MMLGTCSGTPSNGGCSDCKCVHIPNLVACAVGEANSHSSAGIACAVGEGNPVPALQSPAVPISPSDVSLAVSTGDLGGCHPTDFRMAR